MLQSIGFPLPDTFWDHAVAYPASKELVRSEVIFDTGQCHCGDQETKQAPNPQASGCRFQV